MSGTVLDVVEDRLVTRVVGEVQQLVARVLAELETGKLAYRPNEAAELLGVGRTQVYGLMAVWRTWHEASEPGDPPLGLRSMKLGSSTLIRREWLIEFLDQAEKYAAEAGAS